MSEKTVNECFQYNRDTRTMVEKVEARHDEEIKNIEGTLIPQLVNRLPPWVTIVIGILTLAIGVLAGVAFK
ncbi:MAG: hypothetical protein HS130_00860 [Deltaproteobacteria bacterium]|nr:hypothetical protein [Deltaproteobacteria bacterium]MCL4873863.1 hypothetical protein [bacterium]